MAKEKKLKGGADMGLFETMDQERINSDVDATNKLREHVTAAPTYTPVNSNEQIVFYNSGATYRVYFYVNNSWKYVALS